jgi:protein-L-isoaspartate O-methyltransferase
MGRTVRLPNGRQIDLSYFVEWRPYLWAGPVARTLRFLGDLQDKRVLEVGGRSGRMSCLFSLLGAETTMVEMSDLSAARTEVEKWGLTDRVRLIQSPDGFQGVADETFDVIFTKSVLWCIKPLAEMLSRLDAHLADAGKVAFVENYRGGKVLLWARRQMVRRERYVWERKYFGITPEQIPLFTERFNDVEVRRHWYFVYTILGRKASPNA